ncbi:MAG: NADH-quinone oxidoreductase subunit H [Candidatus Micrarchaeota archaeon]|nr:NADH-quinone oxidoreductase subunit H [Candidatus Micrarchaeota archaeon]
MEISSGGVGYLYTSIYGILHGVLSGTGLEAASLLIALIIFAIALALIFTFYTIMGGWLERKLVARIHSRRGPTYLGKWGVLQNVADAIKLVTKENIIPDRATRLFVFTLPVLTALFILMLAFMPFSPTFIGFDSGIGLILVFLILSFSPLLVFLAGWTSGNKFGSISAQRAVVMMLSYEAPLILVVVAIALLAGTYSLQSIVQAQSSMWYIVLMPLGFVLFFFVLLAELERPPFDLKEADSELIAGWLTDVSAPYYAMALLLDYTRLFVGSLLITVLFLGGWNGPILPSWVWTAIKVVIVTTAIIVVRGTLFRMRLDRILRMGWIYLLPLSVANLLITFIIFR